MKTLSKADSAKKLKSFLKNNHGLRPQDSDLVKDTKSAAFELGPRPDFIWNVYVECRWDPWSKSPDLMPLQKDVVRIVVQLKGDFANLAESVASTLGAASRDRFDVRVSQSEGTVYIRHRPISIATLSGADAVENFAGGLVVEGFAGTVVDTFYGLRQIVV